MRSPIAPKQRSSRIPQPCAVNALLLSAALLLAAALPAQQDPPPPAPPDVLVEPGIRYTNSRLEMDVVRPLQGEGPFPAVLCIHGGGFRAGTRQSYLPVAYHLAQNGYVAATVSYRLSPMAQFPAPVEDVKAAVRFLRANAARFQIDPNRIGAVGSSAGGHLALMLGLTAEVEAFEGPGIHLDQSSQVQAVVNFYGPTELTKLYEPGQSNAAHEVLPMFLGGALEHNRPAHLRASPLHWVTPGDAPTLTIHGSKDETVSHNQGVLITERLEQTGIPTKLETIQGAGHGFKGADRDQALKAMDAWFAKHLAPTEKQRLLVVADHGPRGQVVAMDWPSGQERWTLPNARGHDVQILANGNVLYTTGEWKRVIEVNPQGHEVWSYGLAEGLEHPIAAERLANGNTVIGDMELGKVIEINPKGETVWEYKNPEMANSQMRSVRRTPQGTTLISVERLNKMIEVDKAGKIIWTFQAAGGDERFPYQAHRLPNGNTLLGMAAPGQIVEVNQEGKIVRTIGGEDNAIRMGWVSGIQPLPEGGFLVSDYTGRRLLEFNKDWKLIHELRMPSRTVASVSMRR